MNRARFTFEGRWSGYLLALVTTALALGLRLLLQPWVGQHIPYATFLAAVAITAAASGFGPGVLATVMGAAAAQWWVARVHVFFGPLGTETRLRFVFYVLISLLVAWLAERQRRVHLRLAAEVQQRKQAEQEARIERQQLEVMMASIGDGMIATNLTGRITFISDVACRLTGWPRAEALGRYIATVFDVRHGETGQPAENLFVLALRERHDITLGERTVLHARDGRAIPIDNSGAPIMDSAGSVHGAVIVFRDSREARAREMELRERDRMIEYSHDAIITADAGRRVIYWNQGAREMYGYSEEEARGQVLHELLRTRNELPLEAVDRILIENGRWDGELIHSRKDGSEIIVESRQLLLRDHDGNPSGILEINRDTTARKHAEAELRRTAEIAEEGRRTLEAVIQHIPEGITIADAPDVRIRVVSRHGVELAGRPAGELLDLPAEAQPSAWGLWHPDGVTPALPDELPLVRAAKRGEIVIDEEWLLRRPDGTAVNVLCNAAPILDREGRITGSLLAWRDMTERKRLDEKLREAAKLESLGVLAGGIAHDFNNLLTGIMGNASLLLEDMQPESLDWSCAKAIVETSERAAILTQQMLAYSGRGRFVVEPVDLSRWLHETMALLQASIAKNVELVLDLPSGLPMVQADVAQMQQLAMNLIVNGSEAIGEAAGRLTVSTRARQFNFEEIRALNEEGRVQPGLYVVLEVTDTGCGMDEATQARMFDPFFTTKFTGRGLGLAAVQGIVRGHGGVIKVYSAPGAGTTIRVLLPAAGHLAPPLERTPSAASFAASGGSVLVVDDENVVRSTAKTALEALGFDVLLAGDGTVALETFRAASDRIRMVILDLTMPGPKSEETIQALRRIRPDVPILLSSGFSEAEVMGRLGAHRPSGFLQKPYTVSTLAATVAAVTGGR